MNRIDTLIVGGASITNSPWFTWADVAIEMLDPVETIDVSAKGTGNYFIALSCINQIQKLDTNNKNILVMPMFTNIDKFDMYLPQDHTIKFLNEKHVPITLEGKPARPGQYSFWSTGGHWPLVKGQYLENFYDPGITTVNTILLFYSLQKLCDQKSITLFPIFDSNIWCIQEMDLTAFVNGNSTELKRNNLLDSPVVNSVKSLLNKHWYVFESLIDFAINNGYPYYNELHKLHPPSQVHVDWYKKNIEPKLPFKQQQPSKSFLAKVQEFTELWNDC